MSNYLKSIKKEFLYYKKIGEQAIDQVPEEKLFWKPDAESNSIAVIVQHLAGNMLSRWTNFLTEDGEKLWRKRDLEFEEVIANKKELLNRWNEGWNCLLHAIESLSENDLSQTILIRSEKHTVTEAINRQLAHYPYHVGQIIFIAKLIRKEEWKSLSIPKNKSEEFNKEKFKG